MNDFDVIILGGGPSGLTASIYTSRAFVKTLVIAGNPSGGQLMLTTEVENFPGFYQGVQGPELVSNMRKQAEKFGAKIADENAVSVSGSFEEGFLVKTDAGNSYAGKSVIVATGSLAKWLGLENEQRLIGKGVSACATCDGFFFKDKVIGVVGGGDASMEEAVYLTKFASKVYLIVRSSQEKIRASKIMYKRALENSKIEFLYNTEVIDVLGENSVSGIKVVNNQTKEEKVLDDVKGLFIAIGHNPKTDFLADFIALDEKGYIKPLEGSSTRSSKEGVFVSGDVVDYRYRQAITAAGFGCMAALDTIKFLEEHGVEVRHQEY